MSARGPLLIILTALAAESRPLVRHFGLRRDPAHRAFVVYRGTDTLLLESGIGRIAAAGATGFAQALSGERADCAFVNIGLAGHASAASGSAFLAHRVTEAASERCWYPALAFNPACATDSLHTVDVPGEYAPAGGCDMEASAFLDTARRTVSAELAHCFKIVSDRNAVERATLDAGRATALIGDALPLLDTLGAALRELAADVGARRGDDVDTAVAAAADRWRLSHSQRTSLAELLRRHRLLRPDEALPAVLEALAGQPESVSTTGMLACLRERLATTPTPLPGP